MASESEEPEREPSIGDPQAYESEEQRMFETDDLGMITTDNEFQKEIEDDNLSSSRYEL